MIVDLHLHSYYSADGVFSIEELLDFFSAGDIAGIADHETIGAWKAFKTEAEEKGIIPVLGVEWFSVGCHILSYFFHDIPRSFLEFMNHRRNLEKRCMYLIYRKLKDMWPDLPTYDAILTSRPHRENILGLPALATALVKTTQMPLTEAEDKIRFIKRQMPENKRPQPFYPEEIIKKINSWGALPVLAHPYRQFGGKEGRQVRDEVESTIIELVQSGIKGIEVFSEGSDHQELEHLLTICKKMNLLATVGSDFHSYTKGLIPTRLNGIDTKLKNEVKGLIDKYNNDNRFDDLMVN